MMHVWCLFFLGFVRHKKKGGGEGEGNDTFDELSRCTCTHEQLGERIDEQHREGNKEGKTSFNEMVECAQQRSCNSEDEMEERSEARDRRFKGRAREGSMRSGKKRGGGEERWRR